MVIKDYVKRVKMHGWDANQHTSFVRYIVELHDGKKAKLENRNRAMTIGEVVDRLVEGVTK